MPHEFPGSLEHTEQKPAQKNPETEPYSERKSQAELICQSGNYETILKQFALPENSGLLEGQIARVRAESRRYNLHTASDQLHEHDWEMLTILELFDHTTFEHCVRTYTIAKEKIESPGPVGIYLRQHIETEGLTPWDIEVACLLHDMGKITLTPKNILLNNPLSDAEWHGLFTQFCQNSFPPEKTEQEIQTYQRKLTENPLLREKDITPLTLGLTPEEKILLTTQGIDSTLPLGVIVAKHQDESATIARRYYPADSPIIDLINNHHERQLTETERTPLSKSVIRLSSLIATLRLADTYDAYRSVRSYKSTSSHFSALAFLITQAEYGIVDRALTRLWIEDDLKKQPQDTTLPENEKDAVAYEKIRAFLTL